MLFEITLPNNWVFDVEKNLYYFYPGEEFDGVLQISDYYHETSRFDPEVQLSKERSKHPSANIVNLSNYDAIHYGIVNEDHTVQYCWITGFQQVMLFCTLTVRPNYSESELNLIYDRVTRILGTLVIRQKS